MLDIFSVLAYGTKKELGSKMEEKMIAHEDLRNNPNWQTLLYDRYHQKVLGICLYYLKDREEAKDATQDIFIKAFRAWGDFEWKCDPLTWMSAIAKHDCFSRIQKFKKQMDRRSQLAHEEDLAISFEPEEEMLLHRIRLEKLLPSVRGKLKEILRFSLEQGLNHREIAIRMGVSRVAITRRLTRFKIAIQETAEESMQTATQMTPVRLEKNQSQKPLLRIGAQAVLGRPKLQLNFKPRLNSASNSRTGLGTKSFAGHRSEVALRLEAA